MASHFPNLSEKENAMLKVRYKLGFTKIYLTLNVKYIYINNIKIIDHNNNQVIQNGKIKIFLILKNTSKW